MVESPAVVILPCVFIFTKHCKKKECSELIVLGFRSPLFSNFRYYFLLLWIDSKINFLSFSFKFCH